MAVFSCRPSLSSLLFSCLARARSPPLSRQAASACAPFIRIVAMHAVFTSYFVQTHANGFALCRLQGLEREAPIDANTGKRCEAFRFFAPRYKASSANNGGGNTAELEKTSRLYASFIFRKGRRGGGSSNASNVDAPVDAVGTGVGGSSSGSERGVLDHRSTAHAPKPTGGGATKRTRGKICAQCHTTKDIGSFSKTQQKKRGPSQGKCRECVELKGTAPDARLPRPRHVGSGSRAAAVPTPGACTADVPPRALPPAIWLGLQLAPPPSLRKTRGTKGTEVKQGKESVSTTASI